MLIHQRNHLLLAFGCCLLLGTWGCQTSNEESNTNVGPIIQERPPNIVVLFVDDLGYGDISCYGHPSIRTPNIDRMASEGMKFTNFYSGSPACTASRYALLTGRYPIRSGFPWVLYPKSERGIHPEELTLAEGLKKAGYATACYGKWHLGTTQPEFLPLQNGFDDYYGLPYSNDMLPPKHPEIALLSGNDTLFMGPDQSRLTQAYTEKAIDFISQNQDQPFLLYVPYSMVHIPLYPGEAFAGRSPRGLYGDAVEEIDWSVGQILDQLEQLNLDENTIVWFTSDNGPWIIKDQAGGSSGLLRDGKGSTWEGGMRVPGIAWGADFIPPGSYCTNIATTLDIYTTSLAMAGIETPNDRPVDGSNISSFFIPNAPKLEDKTFFYYGPRELHAVRSGKWKLHLKTSSQTGINYFAEAGLPLLFNLEEDPSEKYDLSEDFPSIVDRLMTLAEEHTEQVKQSGNFWDQTIN